MRVNPAQVALLLTLLTTSAHATSPAYQKCAAAIDSAALTSSQRLECATTDMDRADAALNATYRDTMSRLPLPRQTALRQEDRAWIDRRRAKCAVENQPANPSRDLNRMLCLVDETDAQTARLRNIH